MTPQERAFNLVARALFDRAPSPDAFNPYADRNPEVDRPDAVTLRRANLNAYFNACQARPALFLLAEAPGPWGCRFSGVPITAEDQLVDPAFPISGRQSSLQAEPYKEYSAGIFWRLLADAFPAFVVWNACPLHPYKPGDPFSIRAPRASELREFQGLTHDLVETFAPARVLAVGRKAERTLENAGIEATYVRHPSQGGATAFRAGVQTALAEVGYHG
ncbi:MAG: uracil-DNA glycosylase [Rhodothermales bacterium]|nr:uracil-DNA glycosylase [Rhodothermales bacterium]MBO6778940.1 uracil-DNA glycosylase [Rhodothermales bacterium]